MKELPKGLKGIFTFSMRQMITFMVLFILGNTFLAFYINGISYATSLVLVGVGLCSLAWNLVHAEKETLRNVKGFHWKRVILRGTIMILFSLFLSHYIEPKFNISRLGLITALTLYQIGIFAVVFDIAYNWFKGKRGWELISLGNQAFQDTLFHKNPWMLLLLDVALFVVSILWLNSVL